MPEHRQFPAGGSLREQIDALLAFAVHAPSTHNSQPWLFQYEENAVNVYLDTTRRLPEADRTGRDGYMSIGCLLKNLEVAARYFGMFEKIVVDPKPLGLVATAYFHEQQGTDETILPLFDAILKRYNARGEMLPPPEDASRALRSVEPPEGVSVCFVDRSSDMQKLGTLTRAGIEAFHGNPAFRNEFSLWMRGNRSPKRDGIHGYSVRMSLVLSYIIPTAMRFFNLGKKLGALNEKGIREAVLAGILLSTEDSPKAWVKTGMCMEELALTAFARGAAASFYAAPIEENSLREEVKKLTSTALFPQFLIIFGVPKNKLPTTPRLFVEERLYPSSKATAS